MIDELETKRKFGYESNELAPFSHKKVVNVCPSCKDSRIMAKCCAVKHVLCNRCQRSKHIVAVRHDPTGSHHSDVTKKKMRASALKLKRKGVRSPNYGLKRTDAHKAIVAESNRERVWSVASKKKLADAHRGKKLPKSQRIKMGLSRMGEKNPNYGKPAAHGKGAYYTRMSGETIWLRSSWETAVAKYLDANDYVWEYESEVFAIEYEYHGDHKRGSYRPDFKVVFSDHVEYWEVKGYWRDDAKEKFEAFTQQHRCQVKLLQKQELLEMGLCLRK